MYSYVYFISDSHGHVKIGKADDVLSRLKELQTGNPYKLSVLLTVMTKSQLEAFNLEQQLHQKFNYCRLEGEWFEDTDVINFIDTDIVKLNNISFGGLKFGKSVHFLQSI